MDKAFTVFLIVMAAMALVVFVALYFVKAGYGIFTDRKWGASVPNRWGWVLMESPVFIAMCALWWFSDRSLEPVRLCFFIFFQLHYLQRSFIFPLLIKGKSRMPLSIVTMGLVFNVLNALMQGGWIFYLSPEGRYPVEWFASPQFIIGTILFFAGMGINIHSDKVIRNLRKPGDTGHYLPQKGLFKCVTSANYFGEILEWTGFAVLTWSWAGAVFAWWTFANLVPRADAIHKKYGMMFPEEMKTKKAQKGPSVYLLMQANV